jgi:group I intron endonuclease
MRTPVIVGVYAIQHMHSLNSYIGSSINVHERLRQHRQHLLGGYHKNKHLQRAWDKHGEDQFVFVVLDRCRPEHLRECEQGWLDDIGNKYNVNPSAMCAPQTPEIRRKRNASIRRAKATPLARARAKETLSDPEVTRKRIDGIRKACNTPEGRERLRRAAIARWSK